MSAAAPDPAALSHQLAARVARRDLPPDSTPAPDTFTPLRTLERIVYHLTRLLPGRNRRGLATQARMCYAFLTHETLTPPELAAAGQVARGAGSYAHSGLVRAGLLAFAQHDGHRHYRLTRFGEDWLLAVARNEAPPAAPQ